MGGGAVDTFAWPQPFSQLLNPGQTSSRMQFFKKVRSDCFQLPMLREIRRLDTSSVRESKVTDTELKALVVSLCREWNCTCLFNEPLMSPKDAAASQCVGDVSEGDESLPSPGLMAPGSILSASRPSSRMRFSAIRKKRSLLWYAGTLHSRRFTSICLQGLWNGFNLSWMLAILLNSYMPLIYTTHTAVYLRFGTGATDLS